MKLKVTAAKKRKPIALGEHIYVYKGIGEHGEDVYELMVNINHYNHPRPVQTCIFTGGIKGLFRLLESMRSVSDQLLESPITEEDREILKQMNIQGKKK